jgi:hypothetical protein
MVKGIEDTRRVLGAHMGLGHAHERDIISGILVEQVDQADWSRDA